MKESIVVFIASFLSVTVQAQQQEQSRKTEAPKNAKDIVRGIDNATASWQLPLPLVSAFFRIDYFA